MKEQPKHVDNRIPYHWTDKNIRVSKRCSSGKCHRCVNLNCTHDCHNQEFKDL